MMQDRTATVYQIFERVVSRAPAAIAIRHEDTSCSYQELAARAMAVAALLPGSPDGEQPAFVILVGRDPVAEIAAILGVIAAGGVAVPVDGDQPAHRLAQIVGHCVPAALLTPASTAPLSEDIASKLAVIPIPIAGERDISRPRALVSPDAAAYVCYTSGSTGEPKGIVTSHRQLIARALSSIAALGCDARDRHTLLHSVSAGAGCSTLWRALLGGATLLPWPVRRNGVRGMFEWLNTERATVLACATTLFRTLMATLGQADQLKTVRLLRLGGERVTPADFALFKRHFSRGAVFVNAYSCTEASNITLHILTHDSKCDSEFVPVGRALPDCHVTIIDPEGNELPANQTGEIAVEGPYLAQGYWRESARPGGRFDTNAESQSRRLRTGDLGYLTPDGLLVHLGRCDFRVKIRGFRVEIEGIETVLQDAPGVHRAAVVVDETSGGEPTLVAYVTASEGRTTVEQLRAYAVERLPLGSVPARIALVASLPLTPSGKVDRAALKNVNTASGSAESNVASSILSDDEEAVAAIWRQVLTPRPFAASDDFFGCGGDSLQAMRVLTRIKQQLGVDVPLLAFFESPTIAELAARIDEFRREQVRIDEVELTRLLDEIDREGSASGD